MRKLLTDAKEKSRVLRADGYLRVILTREPDSYGAPESGGRRRIREGANAKHQPRTIAKERRIAWPRSTRRNLWVKCRSVWPNARLASRNSSRARDFARCPGFVGGRTKMRRDVPRDAESSLTSRYENPMNLSTVSNMANPGGGAKGEGCRRRERLSRMRNYAAVETRRRVRAFDIDCPNTRRSPCMHTCRCSARSRVTHRTSISGTAQCVLGRYADCPRSPRLSSPPSERCWARAGVS